MLLALERRRIAHPKAQDYVDFQNEITAGIFGGRNGLQHSLCGAEDRKAGCLHWVDAVEKGKNELTEFFPCVPVETGIS